MASINKIIYSLLVFLYLFAYGIKLLGIPVSIFISIASVFYIYVYGLAPNFLKIWSHEIILILTTVCYLLFIETIHGVGLSVGNFSFYITRILIDGILPAYVISDIGRKSKINVTELVYILVVISIFEFIISGLMIFLPEFKSIILEFVKNYNDQNVEMNEHLFLNRGFGIAYTYLAWFPFSLGLIFIFCLFSNAVSSKLLMSIYAIAVFILIALNARIGFIPLLLGLIIYISISGIHGLKKIVSLVMVIFMIFYLLSFFDSSDQIDTRIEFFKSWVIEDGFSSLNSQQGSQTVDDLSNFKILSEFNIIDFVFGKGDILVPEKGDLYTDVGYLQILFNGGLVLSFLLYSIFFLFAKQLVNAVRGVSELGLIPRNFGYFTFFICVSFVVGHAKLRIFEINEATRFLLLIISFFLVLIKTNCAFPRSKIEQLQVVN